MSAPTAQTGKLSCIEANKSNSYGGERRADCQRCSARREWVQPSGTVAHTVRRYDWVSRAAAACSHFSMSSARAASAASFSSVSRISSL